MSSLNHLELNVYHRVVSHFKFNYNRMSIVKIIQMYAKGNKTDAYMPYAKKRLGEKGLSR